MVLIRHIHRPDLGALQTIFREAISRGEHLGAREQRHQLGRHPRPGRQEHERFGQRRIGMRADLLVVVRQRRRNRREVEFFLSFSSFESAEKPSP
jgi:hypothetical protein